MTKNTEHKQTIKKEAPLVIVTTGGSGGHIFPAESISAALLKKGYRVAFVTDKRGANFHSLPNVQAYRLVAESVAGGSRLHKLIAMIKLLFGAAQALHLIMKLKPSLVIGVGGYASFPAVIAAYMWNVPVMLHEQNAVLGRANRFLSNWIFGKRAEVIATSFEPTLMVPNNVPQVRVGMPARPQVLKSEKAPYQPIKDTIHLLIFGGSQGASFFSRKFPDVLTLLPEELQRKIVLTQQARPEDEEYLQEVYQKIPFKKVTIASFFDNMPALIKESHLIISRGGASTAADNHQMENARQFCDDGAGWLINEKTFSVEQTAQRLMELLQDKDILVHASGCAYNRSKPEAAQQVAQLAENIIKGKK